MSSAFAWLGQIIEWFGQFFPRWAIVRTTHAWVKWVRGSRVLSGTAGIVWYWPATTDFVEYPVVRQTTPLPSQVITLRDDTTVTIGGLLVFSIHDVEKLIAHNYDADDTVRDIAQSALLDVCCKMSWEELHKGQGRTLDTKLRNAARDELLEYGVTVVKFSLTTLAKTRVYRLIQSSFQEGEVR
jgi:regulator of protease activity HflC (stomatin/prohibitin superfamily)